MGVGIVGVARQRTVITVQRRLCVPQVPQGIAAIVVGLPACRGQLQRRVQCGQGCQRIAKLAMNDAAVVERFGILRRQRQGAAIALQRLFKPAKMLQQAAARGPGVGLLGIGGDGLVECCQRVLRAIQFAQGKAAKQQQLGMAGRQRQRPVILVQGIGEAALLVEDAAQIGQDRQAVRPVLEDLKIVGGCAVQIAALLAVQRLFKQKLELRVGHCPRLAAEAKRTASSAAARSAFDLFTVS